MHLSPIQSPLILPGVVATLLTPLVVSLWSRLYPPRLTVRYESRTKQRRRNGWIDVIATLFMFGFIIPFFLWRSTFNAHGIWSLGLMFGLAVCVPFVWICFATLPFGGIARFSEFWRFYETRWGIGLIGIRLVRAHALEYCELIRGGECRFGRDGMADASHFVGRNALRLLRLT